MKTRLLWIAILAIGITALYFGIARPQVSSIPEELRKPIADLKPVLPPPIDLPVLVIPPTPTITPPPLRPVSRARQFFEPPEVPIQHNATIDFSTGAPVVKTFGKDKEDLEKAMREIAEVTKGTSFEAKKTSP
jgi:hypothetical protein